jgi:predicted nucleic acid-binding protein
MQTLVLVDSNVFIRHLRDHRDPILEIAKAVALENVVSCGVVKAEVLRGVRSPKIRDGLEAFFAVTQNVATSASLWDEVWRLAWQLDRRGAVIPLPDLVIACCALRAGAAVMTDDAHFHAVPGLQLMPSGGP